MGKALVIKGADFSENKLATVVISDEVPCTGISLDESTITATSFDDQTLTATVSPVGCTDEVVWSTSDASVATVEDGVVSLHALGEVTITATCGEYSADCVITVDNVEISTGFRFGSLYISGSNDYATANVPSNYKTVCYADAVPLDSTRLRHSRNTLFVGDFNLTAYPLPAGVGSIQLVSNNVSGAYYMPCFDSTQHANNQSSVIKLLAKNSWNAPSSGIVDKTVNVAEGADSFNISLVYKTQYAEMDVVDTVTATNGTKIILKRATVEE